MENQNKFITIKEMCEEDFVISFKEYQREFVWNINDVISLLESFESNAFVGTVSFVWKNNKYEIIDGQQRLTSIALLYGGLELELDNNKKSTLFKISFNFSDSNHSNILNKIINNISLNKNDEDVINDEGYLLIIKKIKDKILHLTNTNHEFKKRLIKQFEKIKISFINVSDFNVYNSFIAMNNRGVLADYSSLLKAHLIEQNRKEKLSLVSQWNKFLHAYYGYIAKGYKGFKKDDALIQTKQFKLKTYNVKISKKNVERDAKDSFSLFSEASNFIKFASGIMPNLSKKEIASYKHYLIVSTIFNKINFDMFVMLYFNEKNKRMNDTKDLKWTIIWIIVNSIEFLSEDSITIETNNEKISFKQYYAFREKEVLYNDYSKVLDLLWNFIGDNRNKIIENWNKYYIRNEYRYIRKENQEKKYKHSYSAKIARLNVFIMQTLYKIFNSTKDINKFEDYKNVTKENIKKFIEREDSSKSDEHKNITYEHILGAKNSFFYTGLLINGATNSGLGKSFELESRIDSYKKNYIFSDWDNSPTKKGLENALKNKTDDIKKIAFFLKHAYKIE